MEYNRMIKRDRYIRQIGPYIHKPFVKVLTGIRRSGKSSILLLLMDELKTAANGEDNLIYINFDNLDYMALRNPQELHSFIKAKMTGQGLYHILLDEIQEVDQWERVVNSLLLDARADIYITGSNSRLLSSELSTYIAGRYVEIKIKPLSFAEYRLFRDACSGSSPAKAEAGNIGGGGPGKTLLEEFEDYIRSGGFPSVHTGSYENYEDKYRIIHDIYSSAVLQDVVERQHIRNIELLNRVVKYVLDNTGNTFSAKRVADYFKNQQRRVDLETVYNYLSALEDAYIITRIPRYDIKGREILKTNEKYYAGDHSLIYALMGYKDQMIAGVLENIVAHELERRGYRVYIGKLDQREIDFIGERQSYAVGSDRIYVQVTYRMEGNQETMDREFAPLLAVKDQYPKYVISMDSSFKGNIEGVKYMSIPEFLLMEEY
jgi:predicted AAA+ superfamily ATPase